MERDNDYDLLSTASATLCLTRRSIVQPPEHLDAGLVTAIATGFEEKATLTEESQEAVANGDDPAKIGRSHVWLVLTDAAGRKTRLQIEPDARLVDFRYRLGWQLPDDLQSQLEELGVVFQS